MIYREADPDRVKEHELEQRLLLEEAERKLAKQRAADHATIRAMKSPLHALRRHVPHGATRFSLEVALVGFGMPLVVALVALVDPGTSDLLTWTALLSGTTLGLAAAALAVRALLLPGSARFAGMVALLLGLLVPLWGLVCAAYVAFSHWRA